MIRSILSIFCLLLLWSSTCYGLEITFRPSAEVNGISIKLSDIVDFDMKSDLSEALGSQIVSPSPAPGEDLLLRTGDLKHYLTSSLAVPDSVVWQGPSLIRIHRNGVRIGPEKIESIIADFLNSRRNDLPNAQIRFLPASLPLPFMLPTGNLTWEVIPSNPGILSSSSISLIFSVDGHVRKNISIAGHIEAMAPVAVAACPIAKGTIVSSDLLHVVTENIAEYSSPIFDIREIVGKEAKRLIREGSVIEHDWIDFPPMVARGQMVKILLDNGDLHLSTIGIASTNGMKGQVIRVQNVNSKKYIYCRVTAPGTVEVQI